MNNNWSFQQWIQFLQSILAIINQIFPPPPPGLETGSPHVTIRDPAAEEQVRLIILSILQIWFMAATNAGTKARIFAAIMAVSNPQTWGTIATIIWGPATPTP